MVLYSEDICDEWFLVASFFFKFLPWTEKQIEGVMKLKLILNPQSGPWWDMYYTVCVSIGLDRIRSDRIGSDRIGPDRIGSDQIDR